jgi:hypothetical protein
MEIVRNLLFFIFVAGLNGCCQSRWCQLEESLRELPADQTSTKLAQLGDEELLDFIAWKVGHTHPPGFYYPDSVVVKRASSIVAPLVARLKKGNRSLVDMEYIVMLREIATSNPTAISPSQRKVALRECSAMFPPFTDRLGRVLDSCEEFGDRR